MNLRAAAVLTSAAALLCGCSPSSPQKFDDELVAADKAFSARSAKEGPKAAYLATLADDAKLLNQYRQGASGVQDLFLQLPADAIMTWEPAFVDVSKAGDLGYTWGRYTLTVPRVGQGGRPFMKMGNYTTIWKRNQLGTWKVVLTGANPDGQK
jgi:ketosteroid isomerase-like protein